MEEVWKPAPGFPGYEISDRGRVRGHKGVLTASLDHGGYQRVGLVRDGKQFKRSIHGLVLAAFVGPRPKGGEGAHADGDRSNNHVVNLRWTSHAGNENDKLAHGTSNRGERGANNKLSREQVLEIRRACKGAKHYTTLLAPLAQKYGVSRWTIRSIITRMSWRWLEDVEAA